MSTSTTPQVIPTISYPFYSQTVDFEGVNYILTFNYNQRENTWCFSIATSDGVDLVTGIKIVCNFPLLKRYPDKRLPPGEILALSNTKDTSPPGLKELGQGLRVELTYFDSSIVVP